MAEVWAARDGEARVALKVLRPEADRRRFEAEIEQLRSLAHPGIAALLDRGETAGRAWFAMTLVDGPDLLTLGEKLRARPVAERHARARLIADELATTLAYVHAQGIVHRDVKPSNVLVGARAVLVDFGVAGPPGQADALVGTPAWAAPEQLAGGKVDARADQYALGLVMYFLLAGRRPFADARARAAGARPRPPSEVDPTVPADLEAVVQRLLEPRPARRFRSMDEVRASLSAVLPSEAPILAGRQGAADQVAAALDRVAAGEGVVLSLRGQVGAGQDWLGTLARASASRRAISCVVADDEAALVRHRTRIDDGEALLLVTSLPFDGAEVIELLPLGVGDIRRSVFAAAPRTPSLAMVAERVHAWTGGHARLVEALLRENAAEGVLRVDPPPALDVSPWVDLLDLDTASAAQALAALQDAATAEQVGEVSRVAAAEVLPELERLGVSVRAGDRWRLAAECFRAPLLATAPDPDSLVARAREVSRPKWAEDPVLGRARVAIEANRHADAIAALLEAVDADQPPEDVSEERRLLLASLHWFMGDGPGASRAWREVRDTSRDPRHRARAGVGLGVVALQAGQLDEALDALSAALVDAELVGDLRTAALAGLDLAEARALRGQMADALRSARRALDHARALRDRALEAKAGRALGQVWLDLGAPAEAERVLADAAALARAAGIEEERVAIVVLRARAALDTRPGEATAAAVALDRLLPVVPPSPDPEGFGALLLAVRARALAFAGDAPRAREALVGAWARAASAPLEMRARTLAEACRAAIAVGDTASAVGIVAELSGLAAEHRLDLLAWEASAMRALLEGHPRPEATELAVGLPDREAAWLLGRAP